MAKFYTYFPRLLWFSILLVEYIPREVLIPVIRLNPGNPRGLATRAMLVEAVLLKWYFWKTQISLILVGSSAFRDKYWCNLERESTIWTCSVLGNGLDKRHTKGTKQNGCHSLPNSAPTLSSGNTRGLIAHFAKPRKNQELNGTTAHEGYINILVVGPSSLSLGHCVLRQTGWSASLILINDMT